MDRQSLRRIQSLFSDISELSFHVANSVDEAAICIGGSLQGNFTRNSQLFSDLKAVLSKTLTHDALLHLQDAFQLHYVIFYADEAEASICVLGPFAEHPDKNHSSYIFLQPLVCPPIFSSEAVINAARTVLACFMDSSVRTVKKAKMPQKPALPFQTYEQPQCNDPDIQKLLHYIHTNLRQKLTLQTLANYFGFSPTYISHHFKETVGIAPMQYIIRQRLLYAQYLLRSTDKSVKEIADAVGISDCSYFTKRFREETGVTPSNYRNTSK